MPLSRQSDRNRPAATLSSQLNWNNAEQPARPACFGVTLCALFHLQVYRTHTYTESVFVAKLSPEARAERSSVRAPVMGFNLYDAYN